MKKYLAKVVFMSIDILTLVTILYVTNFLREKFDYFGAPAFSDVKLHNFYFVIFIIFALMYLEKIYNLNYDYWQEMQKIFKSLFLAYMIVLSILMLTKANLNYSRLFITLYFVLSVVIIPFVKRYSKKFIYIFSFFKKKVLLVGNQEQIQKFKDEFNKNFYLGIELSHRRYNMVIIASKDMSNFNVNKLINRYLYHNCELYVVPYITDINFYNSNILEYSNIRHNVLQIENKLLIKKNIWIKNIFDMVISLIALPAFLFLHLIVALGIKLDSVGNILFKQKRLGKDSKEFVCYKYRTMYENSEELLKNYLKENPFEEEYYQLYHKYKNDPRITKIGKILRKTSLDELPQFLNVLKGNMSLVGPRPYMLEEIDKLGKNRYFILKAKPGITGLWQVSGRNNLTFKERNDLETWYIKNWSLWADFVILIKTIKVILLKTGAR
jgi:undecaprenyl-phosphate galactose phosphotransferase